MNTFGFILENASDINEFSNIQIYDKTMNTVGKLYFDNGKVMIQAKYSKGLLTASYDIAKIFSFVDMECGNGLFGQWSSKIDFQIENNDGINFNGEFLIGNTVDSQFGISCLCHPLINCVLPNKENVTIKILRDGLVFGGEIVSESYNERINISPCDKINGFLLHDIRSGKYDTERHGYPYRKYIGIFNGADRGENKDKLHVFLTEEEYNNSLNYYSAYVPKVEDKNSSKALIQKGTLMQKLDNSLVKRILDLRELLLIDDISLLDNLISVCYDGYTDEELRSLLGIEREKNVYQDGADKLVDSYFGIGKDNQFLSLEAQKRLLKR